MVDDTRRRLDDLRAENPALAQRGLRLVELVDRLGDEYRAEVWARELRRGATGVAADLLELNRRDILGFSVWKHAWTLERVPDTEPGWAVIEARAQERRGAVEEKSQQAKEFAKQRSGCRVRAMLEYFGAEAPEKCGRCDLCTELERPWAGSHISREGLVRSLPTRGIVLQLLDDTSGTRYSRRNLERTLVGNVGPAEQALPERLARHHLCGRLAFLGAPDVTQCVDDLIEQGLARAELAVHEGRTYERLEITDEGLARLRRMS